jgi:hypothetical protein
MSKEMMEMFVSMPNRFDENENIFSSSPPSPIPEIRRIEIPADPPSPVKIEMPQYYEIEVEELEMQIFHADFSFNDSRYKSAIDTSAADLDSSSLEVPQFDGSIINDW